MGDERELDDDAIERLKQERFQQRVQRVLAAMREERVDWRGVPVVTPDGRIAVRVVPVEAGTP
jgi:predicted N-acetyltransferase YhbS